MGRWAQQRKRGGHLGEQPGLPAGPSAGFFHLEYADSAVRAVCDSADEGIYTYWTSRWRVPALSTVWTNTTEDPAAVGVGESQPSMAAAVIAQQQDGETAFVDADGVRLTQWSAYHSIVPA